MAKTANCPSCGAPVTFRAAASTYAVCEFCRSTLVRQDQELKNLGRMADLLEDNSLIQLGTEGSFKGVHFGVVGRIQLKYGAGFWNEWHILFDDGRSGWLSEAGGEYVISFLKVVKEPLPAFERLQAGMVVPLAGREFTVTNLESAYCIAGEGELPFKVDSGYDVNTVDLRDGDNFATIDYSETPPMVFLGRPVRFSSLKLANLRGKTPYTGGATVKVKAFACPKCAAPLTVHTDKIETVACGSCGSIVDATDPNYAIIAEANRAKRVDPRVPLGSKGKFGEVEWEVIGFMRRQSVVEGVTYPWSEYLLHEPKAGFAWLIESEGHWNLARVQSEHPTGSADARQVIWERQGFKHFSSASAEVTYVVGEFYWRVSVGEKVDVSDYVLPPRMLSLERSEREISWSLADYIEPEEIWAAFKLKTVPPTRSGIGPNQPNPHMEAHQRTKGLFWKASLFALFFQIGFMIFSPGGMLHQQTLSFHAGDNEAINSTPFRLDKEARNLEIFNSTDLDNGWIALNIALVNQETGEAKVATREISYFEGYDEGDKWSEGDKDDTLRFGPTPAGTYILSIDAEGAPELTRPVISKLEIRRNVPGWINWILLQLLLLIFPLVSRARVSSFESRRWAESDHAPGESEESED